MVKTSQEIVSGHLGFDYVPHTSSEDQQRVSMLRDKYVRPEYIVTMVRVRHSIQH